MRTNGSIVDISTMWKLRLLLLLAIVKYTFLFWLLFWLLKCVRKSYSYHNNKKATLIR